MHADPKRAKRQSIHHYVFALLRSLSANAAQKMLPKLTPG
jgi:hypothetical protein